MTEALGTSIACLIMCRKVEQEDYLLEQLRVTRWRKKIPREGQNEVGRIWPLPIVTITL